MSICEPKKTEIARADNRSAFPETAKIVDAFREQFGSDVRLLYAEEGGKTVGKPRPLAKRFLTATQWLQGSELVQQDAVKREARGRVRR